MTNPAWGHSGSAPHLNTEVPCSGSTRGRRSGSWQRAPQQAACALRRAPGTQPCPGTSLTAGHGRGSAAHTAGHGCAARRVPRKGSSCSSPRLLNPCQQPAQGQPRKAKPQQGHRGAAEGTSRVLLLPSGSQLPQHSCALCDLCRNFNNNEEVNKSISLLPWYVDTFPSRSS